MDMFTILTELSKMIYYQKRIS